MGLVAEVVRMQRDIVLGRGSRPLELAVADLMAAVDVLAVVVLQSRVVGVRAAVELVETHGHLWGSMVAHGLPWSRRKQISRLAQNGCWSRTRNV